MTFIKRLATSFVLFIVLFCVLYVGICAVGGGIAGGIAGATDNTGRPNAEIGREAGGNFVKNNIRAIAWSSFGISLAGAIGLSFSGILPWCRKPVNPPENPFDQGQMSGRV